MEKVLVGKELLNKLIESIEIPEETNWLDSVPEKHRKFAAYWDEIGRPELEYFDNLKNKWVDCYGGFPSWMISTNYRIKPAFHDTSEYRESKPWYDQEISKDKPILLKHVKSGHIFYFTSHPLLSTNDEFYPLTDEEIDVFKRGF